MNDEWLDKIHDRMTDYEIDEPDTLWASIEKKQAEDSKLFHLSKRHVIMTWVRRVMTAAAMLTVAIALGLYLFNNPLDFHEVSPQIEITQHGFDAIDEVYPEEQFRQDLDNHNIAQNTGHTVTTAIKAQRERLSDNTKIEKTDRPVTDSGVIQQETKPERSDSATTISKIISHNNTTPSKKKYISSITPRHKNYAKLSFSVYTSGGTGRILNRQSFGDTYIGSIGPDGTAWEDTPILGILVFNQGKAIETDIKHRLPIRAGLSFAYNITDRLGIESGLCYTNLTSDIREGSESHYIAGKQKLHYIGIPLNLKYRIFSWNKLDLYGSAGVLTEKCISAKMDKNFVLNNRNGGTKTENITDKPLQLSVNSSIGMQWNLINSIGLYAEPGISYYFKDNANIQTIYKEKPLNFNLNLGLRFTFGK